MKFVVLVSTGIDSPVSAYVLSKYATSLVLVHASIHPYGDEKEKDHFINLVKSLSERIKCPIKIYYLPHGEQLAQYQSDCEKRFTCVFCKRMMIRYANAIAEIEGADALVTGDSLGQVASQTLQNIKIIDSISTIPILRPLIGLDKEEIIKIAKELGTFDLSIIPQYSCRAVPSKPATHAKQRQILHEEKKLAINELINQAVTHAEIITI